MSRVSFIGKQASKETREGGGGRGKTFQRHFSVSFSQMKEGDEFFCRRCCCCCLCWMDDASCFFYSPSISERDCVSFKRDGKKIWIVQRNIILISRISKKKQTNIWPETGREVRELLLSTITVKLFHVFFFLYALSIIIFSSTFLTKNARKNLLARPKQRCSSSSSWIPGGNLLLASGIYIYFSLLFLLLFKKGSSFLFLCCNRCAGSHSQLPRYDILRQTDKLLFLSNLPFNLWKLMEWRTNFFSRIKKCMYAQPCFRSFGGYKKFYHRTHQLICHEKKEETREQE